jgi:hypothetical protein
MNLPHVEVVIPSKKRAQVVPRAMAMFPDPIIMVDEIEYDHYRAVLGDKVRIRTHPSLPGLPEIRQHIMDTTEAEVVFQCDDDVLSCWALPGDRKRRLRDPQAIYQLLQTTALCAKEAGTICFYYNAVPDIRKFKPTLPFMLAGHFGGWVQGFWREEFNQHIRYDPAIRLRQYLDVSARVLIKYRLMWCDSRFGFYVGTHMVSAGGMSGVNRTPEAIAADMALLKARYGDAVDATEEGQLMSKLDVRKLMRRKGQK